MLSFVHFVLLQHGFKVLVVVLSIWMTALPSDLEHFLMLSLIFCLKKLECLLWRNEFWKRHIQDWNAVFLSSEAWCLLYILTVALFQLKGEITYEVKDPAYCYSIVEIPSDLCSLSRHLTKWLSEVEHCKVILVNICFSMEMYCNESNGPSFFCL